MERRGAARAPGHRRVHRRRPARDVRPRGRRGGADRPGPSEADAAFAGSPYLDYAELERALRACRADAVWPGWGFVSEKAEFAELCDRLGITFIGPSAEVMRRLGDKIESKLLAEQAGVPLAPWSGGPVPDLAAARAAAESIGYPLMVKATAGGGGRGIRMVRAPEDLEEAFERASSEASKTAGDATVFLERAIRGGRHVEVQVVADAAGTVWTLGVRDCSVQRRNQKVIEESASTALDAEQEKLLRGHAAELVRAAGYVNAGTVEFLYEPSQKLLSFLEVNTRLQVEHPVTEACTGADIVKLQLHIAAGGTLAEIGPGEPPARGHAIEARLTAEDPERDFAPAPGLIEHLALPAGPGIRVDTGVAPGDVIPPQFDSMIAKVIAWGQDRAEARARLSRAIRQTSTVIQGGTTSKAFLLDLLDRPEFVRGEIDTTWLDTMMAEGYAPPLRVDVALLATAFEAYEAHERRQQDRLFTSAERGRPEVGHETRHQVDVRVGGEAYKLAGVPEPPGAVPGRARRPFGRSRRRPVRPVRDPAGGRRPDLRRALGRAGPGLPGRGGRRGAPDLRRRGRAGPRPGPGHGGGHLGRGRGRGRRGRRGGRGGEHEAGDLAARPGLRPGRRGVRRRQHAGGERRQAAADRARGGRGRGGRGGGRKAPGPTWTRWTGRPRATRIRPPWRPTRWRRCVP